MKNMIKQFVKDRDSAFIEFVMTDKLSPIYEYAKKYSCKMPDDEKILKASVYKAVQECTNIPVEVKQIAYEKCKKLGFYPFVKEVEK